MGKKVLIAGYFGFNNTGDEAILGVLLQDLRKSLPTPEIVVVSGNPEVTSSVHQVKSVAHNDISALISEIESSDVVMLGGGGLFHDYWGVDLSASLTRFHSGIAYYNTFFVLAVLFQKPLVLNAIGVGPLHTDIGRQYTRMIFEQAGFATVRDAESKELLVSIGVDPGQVKVTADPAFSLEALPDEHARALLESEGVPPSNKLLIGVSLREWQFGTTLEEWAPQIARAMDDLIEHRDASIFFLPFQRLESDLTNDLAVSDMVRKLMRNQEKAQVLNGNYTTKEIASLLAQCDVVVGMRLHSIIFAAKAGVPTVGIIYDPKVQNLMRQLKCEEYALALSDLTASKLTKLIESAYERSEEIATRLDAAIGEQAQLGKDNSQALMEWLADDAQVSFKVSPSASAFLKQDMLSLIEQADEREKLLQAVSALQNHSSDASPVSFESSESKLMAKSNSDTRVEQTDPSDYYRFLTIAPALPQEESLAILNIPLSGGCSQRLDVICFSIIHWDFRYQRPQQIMSQYAEQGHRVFYISPILFLPSDATPRVSVKQIKENVFDVQIAVERTPDIFGEAIEGDNQAAILASIDELRRTFHIEEAIAFVMIASWTNVVLATRQLWGWHTIYDCMDNWEDFPLIEKAIFEMERQLVEQNDLIVVTAQRLYEKWGNGKRPIVLARNAVDYNFYVENCQPNTLLAEIHHPTIGYYGAISDWFDIELMIYVARQRPNYTFVLLGGVYHVDVAELSSLPNVKLLGQQPYETMPQYLYHFDACMIPFKIDKVTEATDPVKMYEYLSAGKPIVSVALPEIGIYNEYLYLAKDRDDFLAKLDQAIIEDDPEMVARRKALAAHNTWSDRYLQIQSSLAQAVPRASIIISTQNNLALTKLCIESIIRNTAYPNYEVIIVDNDSDDNMQAYLRLVSDQFHNFNIFFNTADTGVMRAINQGIAQSTGQYLVLLNNDTIVPPGWMGGLLRHLQDRAIGIVVPVTNFLGSNTAIETFYTVWAEMEAFATSNSLMNDGDVTDIEVLTRFCIALRREVFESLGPVDESVNLDKFEAEYAQQVKLKGYRVVCASDVFVHYFGRTALPSRVKIAEREETIKTLQARVVELNKQSLQSAFQISEKERALQSARKQLRGKEQTIKGHLKQLADNEQSLQSMSSELAQKCGEIEVLSFKASQAEQNAQALSTQLATKERSLEVLDIELSMKNDELMRITSSLGWRLLSRYGQIKYRYLLPLYKALGLPPYHKKREQNEQIQPMPFEQFSNGGQSLDFASSPESLSDALSVQETVSWQGASASNTYDVVCFPIIDWDFRFQRPQQLMLRFAEAGHRVFYISQNFFDSESPYLIQEKQKNIFEISLRGPKRVVYKDVLDKKACDSYFKSLDALRRDLMLGATVAIGQLPFWWPLIQKAHSRFGWPIVYDCMDYHAGFSTNKKRMIDQEHDLLTSADLVVVSSDFLEQNARPYNSNPLMVRNACDYEHFAKVGQASSKQRPVIGYYGAIADWFDADLVADLAERRPDWDFLLVGSTFSADLDRLSKLANVSLPGEQPYATIPDWLAKFDVAIIPFQRTPLTEATNPVKAYEILASGKPLVSVPIPEVAALHPLVRLASTAEEFDQEIAAALDETDPLAIETRRAFAREHTWEKRYEVMSDAVCEVFPKASIVIVTFHNLQLNRLCLESLYARTEWPNFEVIVVDNASNDGTPAYLLEAEKTFPNLRVVLNDNNLGFAAANNIGLKMATGDYLVLLNNDTVVTRGWLSALIRHLHSNPKIGMIGPVTNAIGNEAKLDVDYTRLEDMPRWAANYVHNHDGQIFAIGMLAMFCVVIPREAFEKVGMLDERFGVGMFEDDDYCHRLERLGYELRCARDSFIHHWQRASFRLLGEDEYLRLYQENRNKYEGKWQEAPVYLNQEHLKKAKSLPPVTENKTPTVEEEVLPVEEIAIPVEEEALPVEADSNRGFYRFQLHDVLAKVAKSKGAIIFLPSVGWNIHLVQRPHHLAREFVRQGYTVIFDSSNSSDKVNGFKEIEENLFLFKGSEDLLHEIPDAVLWAFPYNFERKDGYAENVRTIYDWIDDLEVFPYDQDVLENLHSRALNEANLVVSVAHRLHEQALVTRGDALYLPNAVEYERFAAEGVSTPEDVDTLLRENKPIAGYYGALAEWFDYQLLDEVAGLRPDWNFLLIGEPLDQSFSQQPVFNRRNVIWIGTRRYESLPQYLKAFDVATIPFVINNITLATSPLKLYEYFAGGKAVITTPMPECQSFPEVTIARNAEEFAAALDRAKALGLDEEFRARVRAIAFANSWKIRVQTVEKLLQGQEVTDRQTIDTVAPIFAKSVGQSASNSVLVSPEGQNRTASVIEEKLSGAAAVIAQRFHNFRTDHNQRFFEGLCNSFSTMPDHPSLAKYFEFAISCNQRGHQVANLLQKQTQLEGKRYLDVGCAHAGFLVAFAEKGAEVAGLDTSEAVLNLGRLNLLDNRLYAPLLMIDATSSEAISEFSASFDIITCNEVIENVDHPQALLCNINTLLAEDGYAYFEIPNPYHPRHILQDAHDQLFGITLLENAEARKYYAQQAPGVPQTVHHYLGIEQYTEMFLKAGMELTILPENFEDLNIDLILRDVAELRANRETGLSEVPAPLRHRVSQNLDNYLQKVESDPRATDLQQQDYLLHYGVSFWRVLGRRAIPEVNESADTCNLDTAIEDEADLSESEVIQNEASEEAAVPPQLMQIQRQGRFKGMLSHPGRCNICGNHTQFFYSDSRLYRESLVCGHCLSTSRYRSIARGILQAIGELRGIDAQSIAELDPKLKNVSLKIYDTQVPFHYETCAYPLPDLLARRQWIEVQTSTYRSKQPNGLKLGTNLTNQNLEALTFDDNSFDIVITSDVMEHVRLDDRAHQEISRVLKPGGIYLFTVPHFRDREKTFYRVSVSDPLDPTRDVFLTEKEYHGDANSEDGRALSYRSYGTDIDNTLQSLGFTVEYDRSDYPKLGIMNTELFYCRLSR